MTKNHWILNRTAAFTLCITWNDVNGSERMTVDREMFRFVIRSHRLMVVLSCACAYASIPAIDCNRFFAVVRVRWSNFTIVVKVRIGRLSCKSLRAHKLIFIIRRTFGLDIHAHHRVPSTYSLRFKSNSDDTFYWIDIIHLAVSACQRQIQSACVCALSLCQSMKSKLYWNNHWNCVTFQQ